MKLLSEYIKEERLRRIQDMLIDIPVPEVIEGDYGEVYPVYEMSYDRKKLCEKLENTAYKVAEHLILLLSGLSQNNDEELFIYWCKEVFSKYIGVQNNDHFKKNDSKANRKKTIEYAYYELKDLNTYDKFERIAHQAQGREEFNSKELKKKNIIRVPIKIYPDKELYSKYLKSLEYVIDMFIKASNDNINDFINKMREIAD